MRHLLGFFIGACFALWASQALAQGDPHFEDVVLLVSFEGSNGQTSATDESNSGHSLTFLHNAQIQSNRLELDGNGDGVTAPDSGDWNLPGDFTLEIFGWHTDNNSVYQPFLTHYDSFSPLANNRAWHFDFAPSVPGFNFGVSTDGTGGTQGSVGTASWSPTNDQEYDIAVERSGSTLRFYVDGTMVGSSTWSSTPFDSASSLGIGGRNYGSSSASDIQELDGGMHVVRFTNGTARYASDGGYSVPSLPLPDFPTLPAGEPGTVHIIVN